MSIGDNGRFIFIGSVLCRFVKVFTGGSGESCFNDVDIDVAENGNFRSVSDRDVGISAACCLTNADKSAVARNVNFLFGTLTLDGIDRGFLRFRFWGDCLEAMILSFGESYGDSTDGELMYIG